MRLILVLLLMVSCGKKASYPEQGSPSLYSYDDADGDGTTDYQENALGTHPLVANFDEDIRLPEEMRVEDERRTTSEMRYVVTRDLRESLLRKLGNGLEMIPDTNTWTISFNQDREYWRNRLEGVSFKSFGLDDTNLVLDATGLNESSAIKVSPRIEQARLDMITKSTYRLIVSTPENDFIFRINPLISPLQFLDQKFKLTFENERLVGLGGYTNIHDSKWNSITIPLNLKIIPQAGETYALVFSSSLELENNNRSHAKGSIGGTISFHNTPEFRFNMLLRGSHYERALIKRIRKDRPCRRDFYHLDSWNKVFISDWSELTSAIKFEGMKDARIEWIEKNSEQFAMLISFAVQAGKVIHSIDSALLNATAKIGIFESQCPDRPVNLETIKTVRKLDFEYSFL